MSFTNLRNPTCSVNETVSMATQWVGGGRGIHGIHSASFSFNSATLLGMEIRQISKQALLVLAKDIQS